MARTRPFREYDTLCMCPVSEVPNFFFLFGGPQLASAPVLETPCQSSCSFSFPTTDSTVPLLGARKPQDKLMTGKRGSLRKGSLRKNGRILFVSTRWGRSEISKETGHSLTRPLSRQTEFNFPGRSGLFQRTRCHSQYSTFWYCGVPVST